MLVRTCMLFSLNRDINSFMFVIVRLHFLYEQLRLQEWSRLCWLVQWVEQTLIILWTAWGMAIYWFVITSLSLLMSSLLAIGPWKFYINASFGKITGFCIKKNKLLIPIFPFGENHCFRYIWQVWKRKAEQYLADSGVPYTIIRYPNVCLSVGRSCPSFDCLSFIYLFFVFFYLKYHILMPLS